MDRKQKVQNLIPSAETNTQVAKDMYNLGHYNWCLFMWHLAIEKIIKAYIVNKDLELPYIHDLSRLVTHANLDLEKYST